MGAGGCGMRDCYLELLPAPQVLAVPALLLPRQLARYTASAATVHKCGVATMLVFVGQMF
jgi:hypothetical protein